MRISVILAHPDPKSFNHAIAQAVIHESIQNQHQVLFHDLYAESLNPVLPANEILAEACIPKELEAHCQELSTADGIVVIHPNWWGQPPADFEGMGRQSYSSGRGIQVRKW